MEKYIIDGKVGVLISTGYGAGWSTWNDDELELATDKRVVEKFLQIKKDNIMQIKKEWESFFAELYPGEYVCVLGADGLNLNYVEQGSYIKIEEYDGHESLEINFNSFTQL